jgi:ABC-2 type transport system permease protein
MRVSLAVFRHNARLLLGDPGPIVLFLLIPLLTMAVMRPTSKEILVAQGFEGANGAEQVVPGFAVMFAFFWISFIGRNFLVEHGWGTWERLHTTPAGAAKIMIGKLLPAFVIISVQFTLLFAVGTLVLGMDSEGPLLALVIVVLPLIMSVLALTVALVAVCRTLAQIDAIGNLATLVFACVGGSLTPLSVLPQWAQDIAPATPAYWVLKAARSVILEGDGVSAVLAPAGVLLAFTAVFAVIAMLRFRIGEVKSVEA